MKQVRESTINSPLGLPCRSLRLQPRWLPVSKNPERLHPGLDRGHCVWGTVEAPGQPSRPSYQEHVDPQVLRANHIPSTETAGAPLASSSSREWVQTFQGAQSLEKKGLCWTLESQEPRLCWDNSPDDPGTHVPGRGLPQASCSLPHLPEI